MVTLIERGLEEPDRQTKGQRSPPHATVAGGGEEAVAGGHRAMDQPLSDFTAKLFA